LIPHWPIGEHLGTIRALGHVRLDTRSRIRAVRPGLGIGDHPESDQAQAPVERVNRTPAAGGGTAETA
jgi:hypothetical protein